MAAELSDEIKEIAKGFSMVMSSPAIVINYDDLKLMKHGAPDVSHAVKMEVGEEEDVEKPVTEPNKDVEPMDVEHGDSPDADDQPATGSELLEQDATDIETIANKKRRIGKMLGELLVSADQQKVCPVCWTHHPDFNWPRSAEQTALVRALMHLERVGELSDEQYRQDQAFAPEEQARTSGEQRDVTAEVASDQGQPTEEPTAEPPTVLPGLVPPQQPQQKPAPKQKDEMHSESERMRQVLLKVCVNLSTYVCTPHAQYAV